jgi:hypothetical protein
MSRRRERRRPRPVVAGRASEGFEGSLFRNGSTAVSFDEQCSAPFEFRDELVKVAGSLVVNPEISYASGPGGHLIKLSDQLSTLLTYRSR